MAKLVICRHGKTGKNAGAVGGERVRGWDSISLNSEGLREASELADHVLHRYKIGRVYTSDIPRAFQTAEIIADRIKTNPIPSEGFRTWNLGELTDRLVSEVLAELQYFDTHPDESPKNGVSKHHFINMYAKDLMEVLDETKKSKYSTVLCTHARNISVTTSILADKPRDVPFQHLPKTGALLEVKPAGSNRWKLVALQKGLEDALWGEVELCEI